MPREADAARRRAIVELLGGTPRTAVRRWVRAEAVPAEDRQVGTRIPRTAYEAIRRGLETGPVLVQTPRAGYAASLACDTCRAPARCTVCTGPLAQPGPAVPPQCRWCGHLERAWACGTCGGRGLRAPVRGEARTAEELGRMFAGTTVRSSSGDRVLARVGAGPAAGRIVAVRQGPLMATSFHPEEGDDMRIHRLFADVVTSNAATS